MLFGAFVAWWYGRGWLSTFEQAGNRMKVIVEVFSIPILLKTMFSPWKQIVSMSTADAAVNEKLKNVVDNLVSRVVGFFVRVLVLFVALGAMLLASVAGFLWIVFWPLIPIMPVVMLLLATVLFT